MEFFHKEEAREGEGGRRKSRSFHGQNSLLGFPSNSSRQMEHKLRKTSAFISFQRGCNRAGEEHPSFLLPPPSFRSGKFRNGPPSNGLDDLRMIPNSCFPSDFILYNLPLAELEVEISIFFLIFSKSDHIHRVSFVDSKNSRAISRADPRRI